jgi:hypothetical protein
MKVKNWIACIQDRGKWKGVVEKAKTFNSEVQRMEEEEDYFVSMSTTVMRMRHNVMLYIHCLSCLYYLNTKR